MKTNADAAIGITAPPPADERVEEAILRVASRLRGIVRLVTPLALAVFVSTYLLFRLVPGLFGTGRDGVGVNHFSMGLFALLPAAAVWWYAPDALLRKTRRLFAETIVRPIAGAIDPAMAYDPGGRIASGAVRTSLLFDVDGEGTTNLKGGHLFRGKGPAGDYAFSVLDAGKRFRHGCHLYSAMLFNGMFMEMAAPEPCPGLLLVFPRSENVTPELAAGRLEAAGSEDASRLVQVEPAYEPQFDRWFVAYAEGKGAAALLGRDKMSGLAALLENTARQPFYAMSGTARYMAVLTPGQPLRLPEKARTREDARRFHEEYHRDIALMRQLAEDPLWR